MLRNQAKSFPWKVNTVSGPALFIACSNFYFCRRLNPAAGHTASVGPMCLSCRTNMDVSKAKFGQRTKYNWEYTTEQDCNPRGARCPYGERRAGVRYRPCWPTNGSVEMCPDENPTAGIRGMKRIRCQQVWLRIGSAVDCHPCGGVRISAGVFQ